jgi:site-specific DNA-methyltransferase (adenine-specific)
MFSFWGDTVLDPFCGTGTTMLAAMKAGRNSIGIEIDEKYCAMSLDRLRSENRSLFGSEKVEFVAPDDQEVITLREEQKSYRIRKAKRLKRGAK